MLAKQALIRRNGISDLESRNVLTIKRVVQLYSTNLLLFISHLLRVLHSGPLAIYHLPETLTRR